MRTSAHTRTGDHTRIVRPSQSRIRALDTGSLVSAIGAVAAVFVTLVAFVVAPEPASVVLAAMIPVVAAVVLLAEHKRAGAFTGWLQRRLYLFRFRFRWPACAQALAYEGRLPKVRRLRPTGVGVTFILQPATGRSVEEVANVADLLGTAMRAQDVWLEPVAGRPWLLRCEVIFRDVLGAVR